MFSERVLAVAGGDQAYVGMWESLKSRLLALGGCDVVPPMEQEPLLGELLESGVEWSEFTCVFLPGEPSRCHDNVAALLYLAEQEGYTAIRGGMTGYALSPDGLWRQHSWAYGLEGEIYETTVERTAYFGVDSTRA